MSTGSHHLPDQPRLSHAHQRLFPIGVTVAEMREPGDISLLLPGEADSLAHAVPKRVGEFVAGRLCARRALANLGIRDFVLRVGQNRAPEWPDGVVGSISHTAGLCLAAVAAKSQVAALGIDCEVVKHVGTAIWSTICGAAEGEWLDSLSPEGRPAAVALIFAAKEAFYKCQYPLTAAWLNFHDVRIVVDDWGRSSATYTIHACRPLTAAALFQFPLTGKYLLQEEFVTAAVAVRQAELITA